MTVTVAGHVGQALLDVALLWCAWFGWRVLWVSSRWWCRRREQAKRDRDELAVMRKQERDKEQREYERKYIKYERKYIKPHMRRRRSK